MLGVSEIDSLPRVVIAVGEGHLLAVDMDGKLSTAAFDEITLDWRYNPATEKWSDASGNPIAEDDDGD